VCGASKGRRKDIRGDSGREMGSMSLIYYVYNCAVVNKYFLKTKPYLKKKSIKFLVVHAYDDIHV